MSIRVAFKKNSISSALENLICLCCLDRHVHAELRFYGYTISSFYNSPNSIDVMLESNEGEWDFQEVPVTNHVIALDIIQDIFRHCHASYGFNPLDMTIPKTYLDLWEGDVECKRPDKWKRIFCSQFVLLFLRRCALAGVLKGKTDLLWSVNTHSCTPAMLRTLLTRVFE